MINKFGDYELLGEIARGGMGIVYRARQISLDREVALKLMRDGALATEQDVLRFRAEAEAAASLQHSGIVSIHEVGQHEGQHYFSMEFVAGRNLAELTRDGPLASRRAAEVMAGIADAVQHAHDRGILHRDLKPSNIIVDSQGAPRITDFGLAKRLGTNLGGPVTISGQILGTPGYMAPEQAAGRNREISPAADTYSLGALLYHVLTGVAPFAGDSPAAVLRQIEEREPTAPHLVNPSTPRDLETICLKALAKEPVRRYPTAREFAEDLRRWLRGEPIQARPTAALERAWRWCQRNPLVALAAGIITLLLVLLAVGSLGVAHRLELARRAEAAGREEAEARLRQGERVLDFLLGDLYTRLEPVGRLDALEGTLRQVDRFYEGLPNGRLSPDAIRHQARAQLLLGQIRRQQGHHDEARSGYQAALKLYGHATDLQPTNTLWIDEFAQAWNSLAIWEHEDQNARGGEAAYRQALRLTGRLIAMDPENASWLDSHASMLHNLGALYDMDSRFEEAERTFGEALRHWKHLLERRPGTPELLEHVSQLHLNLAFLYDKLGQPQRADEANAESLRLREELVALDPNNLTWLSLLADVRQNIADRCLRHGQIAEAEHWVNLYRPMREKLATHDPANAHWQVRLAEAWRNYALVLVGKGDDSGAVEAYQRARQAADAGLCYTSNYGEQRQEWLEALQAEEELHARLAQTASEKGDSKAASAHERLVAELRSKRLVANSGQNQSSGTHP
jgi:tetratricopeptide (TPR) repeat protein